MGDTVTITSGAASTLPAGTKIAVDDAGADGVVQLVGIVGSADGTATKIAPATEGKQDNAIALLGTMDADTSAIAGAVVANDAAAAGTPTGIPGMMIRDDVLTALSVVDGDWTPPRGSEHGAKWVAVAYPVSLDTLSGVGADTHHNVNAGTAVSTVKASAGTLYGYTFANLHASSKRFVKLYDATSPSVGAGTPKRTIPIPPDSTGHIAIPYGIKFGTAIKYIVTTGVADNDTGAPGSNEVVFEVDYK